MTANNKLAEFISTATPEELGRCARVAGTRRAAAERAAQARIVV